MHLVVSLKLDIIERVVLFGWNMIYRSKYFSKEPMRRLHSVERLRGIEGINEGKQIHGHVLKIGLGCDVLIHTSLINFYSQSGQLEDARLVFDKSTLRDADSFTALITGYIAQGSSKDARKLFDEMPVRDVVSWNSIIAGHTRTKRFQDAINLFKEMQIAKVKPDESTLAATNWMLQDKIAPGVFGDWLTQNLWMLLISDLEVQIALV
ncbi:hypothetical protein L2E82_27342 [Cichorium intybus]|uniref:Uncharacterized protein n=1 Tax=Cichorium intybus TaxID=13427 RepID=A0ACB9CSR7_CICIN|nr:hypothetical protein L2E82_27342 [Cichorium intybus]